MNDYYIAAVYQLVALGFVVGAVGLFFTLFARAIYRVVRSFWND